MADAGRLNELLIMSNYSAYFLSQNTGLHTNCSVYFLTSGWLQNQDLDTKVWGTNSSELLPAYYVTNCLIPDLISQIQEQNLSSTDLLTWLSDYRQNPYNVSDNGDSFVALLYTLSALCVLCWMLMFLFLLLPKNKRKPLLTQGATLLYSMVLTIILARLTDVARLEYYLDSLDISRILEELNSVKRYPIAVMILQFLTNLALAQLVVELTKLRWKRISAVFGILVILAHLAVSSAGVHNLRISTAFLTYPESPVLVAAMVLKLIINLWLVATLAYYTLSGSGSPRHVCYSRQLIPMACFAWTIVVAHLVVSILPSTLWRSQWLVYSWLQFIPLLLEMFILTVVWEWVYSIQHIEKRMERTGMLGRKVSLDDVISFNDARPTRRTILRSRFSSFKDTVFGQPRTQPSHSASPLSRTLAGGHSSNSTVEIDLGDAQESSHFDITEDPDHDEMDYEVHYMDEDVWDTDGDEQPARTPLDEGASASQNIHQPTLAAPHDVASTTVNMAEGTPSAAHPNSDLPPFRPLPGFSRDDYWDEKN